MKIKRFFAKDMRSGLAEVKSVLGPDAVIMQNRKVTGGVEIVAAVDGEDAQPDVAPAAQPAPAAPVRAPARSLSEDKITLGGGRSKPAERQQPQAWQWPATEGNKPQQPVNEPSPVSSLSELLERQSRRNNDAPSAAKLSWPDSQQAAQSSFFQQQQAQAEQQGQSWEPVAPRQPAKRQGFEQAAPSGGKTSEMATLREEMQSIRQLLEHQVSGLMWQEVERREPMRAFVIKQLQKLGLAEEVADQITLQVPENVAPDRAWALALDTLCDQLNTSGDDLIERGGIVALLGPTGVGKTTTLAKLAARYAMRYGADQVGLVTTDTYRIGAHEQLATYGRIMGCPVKVASDAEELEQIIRQLANRRMILIDTAGMGQRDTRLGEQLDNLVRGTGLPIRNYLVMPATAQRQVLEETIMHFRRVPLAGCIFTKLDECLSLGELFSVAIQHALSISYVTDGQRVPEDIKAANSHYLVSQAVDMFRKQSRRQPSWMTAGEAQMAGNV